MHCISIQYFNLVCHMFNSEITVSVQKLGTILPLKPLTLPVTEISY